MLRCRTAKAANPVLPGTTIPRASESTTAPRTIQQYFVFDSTCRGFRVLSMLVGRGIFFDEDGTLCDASATKLQTCASVLFNVLLPSSCVCGSQVTTYLLESSRVVVHAKRERTYHCFYVPRLAYARLG